MAEWRMQRAGGGRAVAAAAAQQKRRQRGGSVGSVVAASAEAARRKQAARRWHLQRGVSGGSAVAASAERRGQRGSGTAMAVKARRRGIRHTLPFSVGNKPQAIFPLPLPSDLAIWIRLHIFPRRYMCKLAFFQNPLTSCVDQLLVSPIFWDTHGGSGCRPRTNIEQIYHMPSKPCAK